MKTSATLLVRRNDNATNVVKDGQFLKWTGRVEGGIVYGARATTGGNVVITLPTDHELGFGRAPYDKTQRAKNSQLYTPLPNYLNNIDNNGGPFGLSLRHFTIAFTEAGYTIALTTANTKAVLRVTRVTLLEDGEPVEIPHNVGADGFVLQNRDVIDAGQDPNCFRMTFYVVSQTEKTETHQDDLPRPE